jgi:hypothetical protein
MIWIVDLLIYFVRAMLYQKAVGRAKAKGVLIYLKTLQVARLSVMGVLAVFALVQILLFGFIGALISGVWLLPQEENIKLWILFGVFAFLFLVTTLLLIFAFSEKVWYRLSGAEEMVEKHLR